MDITATVSEALAGYQLLLETEGPAALGYLNARVPHRYTAVYRLADGTLRNIHIYDKLGEITPEFLQEVPLQDSFCQFVLKDGMFSTCDCAADSRLDGHKYQGTMGSYHGLPILDNAGELFGTICHFDTERFALSDEEFEVFKQAAKLLPRYLSRRPPSAMQVTP